MPGVEHLHVPWQKILQSRNPSTVLLGIVTSTLLQILIIAVLQTVLYALKGTTPAIVRRIAERQNTAKNFDWRVVENYRCITRDGASKTCRGYLTQSGCMIIDTKWCKLRVREYAWLWQEKDERRLTVFSAATEKAEAVLLHREDGYRAASACWVVVHIVEGYNMLAVLYKKKSNTDTTITERSSLLVTHIRYTSNMDTYKYDEFLPKYLLGLSPDASFWTMVALVLSGVSFILLRLSQPKHHPQEPVVIPQGIPYIGHVVGIVKHGLSYYQFIQ